MIEPVCYYCGEDYANHPDEITEVDGQMLCNSCAKFMCNICNYSPCACNELPNLEEY